MPARKSPPNGYEWMQSLSAEGWAWEFLRRNTDYREAFATFGNGEAARSATEALKWGLLDFVDPAIDARSAVVFWNPAHNSSVLPLTAQKGGRKNPLSAIHCTRSYLDRSDMGVRHVLFSCSGRFLQLAVTGECDETATSYLVDPLPENGTDRRILSLRKLCDLAQHKRLRSHLYVRQRRGPRFAHVAMVLDAQQKDASHRAIAHSVYGVDAVERDWDTLRDHVRRAIAAGRKLTQGGYLRLLA